MIVATSRPKEFDNKYTRMERYQELNVMNDVGIINIDF